MSPIIVILEVTLIRKLTISTNIHVLDWEVYDGLFNLSNSDN